jgi:thioredoxin reductase
MTGRVHYELRDARSFRGQRLLVVGLGDSAMEAAQALARQPGVQVTVSYRGRDFRRGKSRNIEAVRRLADEGKIELVFESQVTALADRRVTLSTPQGSRILDCDALLVMIGSIPNTSLVEQALGSAK